MPLAIATWSAWVIDDDGWLANPGKSPTTNTPARAIAVSAACDVAPAAVAAHATAMGTTAAAEARVDHRRPERIAAGYGLGARILDHLGVRRAAPRPRPPGAHLDRGRGGVPGRRAGVVGPTGRHRRAGRPPRRAERAARVGPRARVPRAP